MGGGRGTRLFPLTSERCKPAVPLAGKYRLVDIPISNCLNSGLNQIYVLTQFNTASLHRHIQESYKFDPFGGGFVDILSAEQTASGDTWYQGTADAVRQNLHHLECNDEDYVVVLSGDQLYQMDFQRLIQQHLKTEADVTIAAKAMKTSEVIGLGLMRVEDDLSISEFVEKPTDPQIIEGLALSDAVVGQMKDHDAKANYVLANMGIYVFSGKQLRESLANDYRDFGKEVIPEMLKTKKLKGYVFEGYWEDIGTVRSFFEANLDLTNDVPLFNFFDSNNPVYTRARYLPASKLNNAKIDRAVLAGGAILVEAHVSRSVIGIRSMIRRGARLENVVMMGADYFETDEDRAGNLAKGIPNMGIGHNTVIRNAIVDKNARIGRDVVLDPAGKEDGFEQGDVSVVDGVLVVRRSGVIPDGTVI